VLGAYVFILVLLLVLRLVYYCYFIVLLFVGIVYGGGVCVGLLSSVSLLLWLAGFGTLRSLHGGQLR